MLVIRPDECIDCALCEPECPAAAIVAEGDLVEENAHFLELNAELAQLWPNINSRKNSLVDAADWDGKKGKLEQLAR